MIDEGILGSDKGALKPTRHPVLQPEVQDGILERVLAAAVGTGPLDPQTAALLALVGPCQLLEVIAPDRSDRKQARRRIAEATEQIPAATAVTAVIDAVTATIIVASAT